MTLLAGALLAFVSATLFGASAYFTRASPRRIFAAFVGGVFATALNLGWDLLATRFGWWRYTIAPGPHAPLALYIPAGFVFGAALGLVGWRLIRRFGARGAFGFLSFFVAAGVLRDGAYAAQGGVFVFGPGWRPFVADAAGYLSLAMCVQLTMLVLAGSPASDSLRARKRHS